MRRCALFVLPGLIASVAVTIPSPAAAYTPAVKPTPVTIGVNETDSVFIAADGRVYGVGSNQYGEITGIGPHSTAPLTGLPSGVRAIAVSTSNLDTLVLGSNGRAYGAGYNAGQELTGAGGANVTTLTPLSGLPSGIKATAVASGFTFSIVLGSNGTVYGSGANDSGQLTGAAGSYPTLTPLTGLPSGVKGTAVAAGNSHTLVLGSDHQVYGAGYNGHGQLTGTSDHYVTLTAFSGLPFGARVVGIEAGSLNSVLLTSAHRAYAVGDNAFGQLGLGTADNSPHPMPVRIPVDDIVATGAGTGDIAVVDSAGYVYAAGRNGFGQLARPIGNLLSFDYMAVTTGTPSSAPGVEVALGQNDTLVRDADGVVLGAGSNSSGQLPGSTNPQPALTVLQGQKVISYARPSTTGTRKVGHSLTAHVGSFSVRPTHYAYHWLRNGSSIHHATKSTYKLTTGDRGKHISVKVTGSRPGFTSGAAISAATATI